MTDRESTRPFFYGSSENKLNAKGQVAIPKRFRNIVPEGERKEGFVLVRGEAECIYMYTHRQFGVIRSRIRDLAKEENDPEFFRYFMENAFAIDLDSQGRFVLPAGLRKQTGINGPEVLFIGMDDRIEIWAPEKRESVRDNRNEYEERRASMSRRIFGL